MERGTSLAGEDRGKGGWNHLDAAVERELLRLSGWGELGLRERGRQVGWRRGEEEKGEGLNEARMKSQQERERPRAAVKQEAQKPNKRGAGHSGRERRLEARWHTGWSRAGWWLFPENLSASLCVRESPLLPQIISHHLRSSTLRFPVSAGRAALLDRLNTVTAREQRDEMWNGCDVLNMALLAQVRARLTSGSH